MARDAENGGNPQRPVIGRVRSGDDLPPTSDEQPTDRDRLIKIALGVIALAIMVGALMLILQTAMSVGGV